MRWIDQVVEGGVGHARALGASEADVRRIRTFNGCCGALVLACPPVITCFALLGAWSSAIAVSLMLAHSIGSMLAIRSGWRFDVVVYLCMGLFAVTLAYLAGQLGGLDAIGWEWVFVPIVYAGVVLGPVGAIVFTASAITVTLYFGFAGPFPGDALAGASDAERTSYAMFVHVLFALTLLLLVLAYLHAQRAAEQELRATVEKSEAAQRRAEEKSTFLATMSHEIRTPLNAVLGLTELTLETKVDPQQRELLEASLGSARVLLGLLDDVLDLSKLEAGKLQLASSPFSLGRLLTSTLEPYAAQAHRKGVELVVDVPWSLPDPLVGDAARIRQVIVNLVSNAVKFTATGEVFVSVTIDAEGPDHVDVHVSVADTGIGVPPEARERIFEAFTQADNAPRAHGTGLGLRIAARLTAVMNGRIWLEDGVPHGSTFHFVAPLGRAGHASHRAPPALGARHVLIVDDNDTVRGTLTRLFETWGTTVTALPSAAAASEHVRATPPDAALLDPLEPGALELAQVLRASSSKASLVVIEPLGVDHRRADWIALGARHVVKPVEPTALAAALAPDEPTTARPSSSVPRAGSGPTRPLKVLVAEDNAVNLMVVRRFLEGRGHHASVVADGEAAVEAVARERFDVVLMDIEMPKLDGLGAARQIRAHERATGGRHTPIIALTAHAMEGDEARYLAAGIDGYVAKPIERTSLFAKLEALARDDD
ncbi:response regulator [Myxococcota bacterium]|nr:response regulator [Myxococcota bacterium]